MVYNGSHFFIDNNIVQSFLPDWVEFIGIGPSYAADHLTMCLAVKDNSAILSRYFKKQKN